MADLLESNITIGGKLTLPIIEKLAALLYDEDDRAKKSEAILAAASKGEAFSDSRSGHTWTELEELSCELFQLGVDYRLTVEGMFENPPHVYLYIPEKMEGELSFPANEDKTAVIDVSRLTDALKANPAVSLAEFIYSEQLDLTNLSPETASLVEAVEAT